MVSGGTELSQKSLQIKQEDKFFSRLLSKESSAASHSLRSYHGGASGAVPFVWESRPGTPKHKLSDTDPLPLSPPPAKYSSPNGITIKKRSRSSLFRSLFLKFSLKKTSVLPSPSSGSHSSSHSSSQSSSKQSSESSMVALPQAKYRRKKRLFPWVPSFNAREDGKGRTAGTPPTTLCFGVSRVDSASGFRGGNRFLE